MDVRIVIKEFIQKNFLFSEEDKDLDDSVSFLDNGIVDSTGMLEIVEFVEEEFDISIEDDELVPENLDSIKNLTGFVTRKTGRGRQGKVRGLGKAPPKRKIDDRHS